MGHYFFPCAFEAKECSYMYLPYIKWDSVPYFWTSTSERISYNLVILNIISESTVVVMYLQYLFAKRIRVMGEDYYNYY